MSSSHHEMLNKSRLTNADQYRSMQKSLKASGSSEQKPQNDDWKDWELTPVTAGTYSDQQGNRADSENAADVAVLQQALKKIDRT